MLLDSKFQYLGSSHSIDNTQPGVLRIRTSDLFSLEPYPDLKLHWFGIDVVAVTVKWSSTEMKDMAVIIRSNGKFWCSFFCRQLWRKKNSHLQSSSSQEFIFPTFAVFDLASISISPTFWRNGLKYFSIIGGVLITFKSLIVLKKDEKNNLRSVHFLSTGFISMEWRGVD